MIENENKICFIVELSAKKPEIAEAVKTLYNQKVIKSIQQEQFTVKKHLSSLRILKKQEI